MPTFDEWYPLFRARTEEEESAKQKDEFNKFEDWFEAFRKGEDSPVPDVEALVAPDAIGSVAKATALDAFGERAQDVAKDIVGFVTSIPGKVQDAVNESFEKVVSGEATEEWADKISPLGQFTPGKFGDVKEFLPVRSPAGVLIQSPRMRMMMENMQKGGGEFLTEIIPHMIEGIARLTPPGTAISVQEHYLDKRDLAKMKQQFDDAGIKLPDETWKSPFVPEGLKMGSDVVVGFITFIPQTLKGFFENPVEYMTEHPFDVALLISMMTPKGLKIAKKAKWRFDNRTWFKLIDSIPEEAMSLRFKKELIRNVKMRGESLEVSIKGWLEGQEVASRKLVMDKMQPESALQRKARHVEPKEVPEGVFEAPDIGAMPPKPLLDVAREKVAKQKPPTIMELEDSLKRKGGLEEFETERIGEAPGAVGAAQEQLALQQLKLAQTLKEEVGKVVEKPSPKPATATKPLEPPKVPSEPSKPLDVGRGVEKHEIPEKVARLEVPEGEGWHRLEMPDGTVLSVLAKTPLEAKKAIIDNWAKHGLYRKSRGKEISIPPELQDRFVIREQPKPELKEAETLEWIKETAKEMREQGYTEIVRRREPHVKPGDKVYRGDIEYLVEDVQRSKAKPWVGNFEYKYKNLTTKESTGWFTEAEAMEMFAKEPYIKSLLPKPEVPDSFMEWADKHGIAEKFGKEVTPLGTLVDKFMRGEVPPELQFKEGVHPEGLSGKVTEKGKPFGKKITKEAKDVADKARKKRKEKRGQIYKEMSEKEMKELLEDIEKMDEGLIDTGGTDVLDLYSGYPLIKEFKESFKRLAKGDIIGIGKPLPIEVDKAIAVTQFSDLAEAIGKSAEAIYDVPNLITEGRIKFPKGKAMWEVPLGVAQKALIKKMVDRLEGMRFPNETLKTHMEYLNNILDKGEIIIPADALTHIYKDIGRSRQGMAAPHYWLTEIDGVPSFEALLKMADNATPIMKYVLYRTHDLILQSLKYENVRSTYLADIADTYSIKVGTPADILAADMLGVIGYNYHKIPMEQLLKKPDVATLVNKASSKQRGMQLLKAAVEARNWYNDAIKAQNLARELRGQPAIPYRQFYTPDVLRAHTLYERASTMMQSLEDFFRNADSTGKVIPDTAIPSKTYNPRELAKKYGLEDMMKVRGMLAQMKQYLPFEVKDIYYNSIIKNNKAFAKMLNNTNNAFGLPGGRTYEHSSKAIMDWTGEAFGGLRSIIDRSIGITTTQAKWMAAFRGALHRSVFPGYVAWSAFIQTSSANLTFGRYGLKAGIKGLKWFTDKNLRKWIEDNSFAQQTKTLRAGDIVRQELNEGLLRSKAMDNPKFLDKVQNWGSYMIREMEKHLTGWSSATAKAWLDAKGHPVNRSYIERVSEGGAKTQSLYHLEDKPGWLRSQVMRTGAPFQTFNFEVFNTVGEMLGRTGIRDASTNVRIGKALRFIGGAMAINFVCNATIGRKPWGLDSAVPFYNTTIGPIIQTLKGKAITGRHLPAPVGVASELTTAMSGYIKTGDWDNLRQWMIKYGTAFVHIPGGTALNNLTEGLIAISEGGVEDSAGRQHFPVQGIDEKLKAVLVGPYRTREGQKWLKERAGKEEILTKPEERTRRLRDIKKGRKKTKVKTRAELLKELKEKRFK